MSFPLNITAYGAPLLCRVSGSMGPELPYGFCLQHRSLTWSLLQLVQGAREDHQTLPWPQVAAQATHINIVAYSPHTAKTALGFSINQGYPHGL